MDSALQLKIEHELGRKIEDNRIDSLLNESILIRELTGEFSKKGLYPVWRLIALSEIPFSNRLKYTKDLIDYVSETYVTSEGFSITGKSDDILPCYNAMMIEAFSKLGLSNNAYVKNSIDWIKKYQIFHRGEETLWGGNGIKKYGGCMKSTPCYIGIAKTVKALIHYHSHLEEKDDEILFLINKGLDYILSHNIYLRLSDGEPITKHIKNIAYPQSYQLNIIDLLEIVYLGNCMNDPRVKEALSYVLSKKHSEGYWKINYVYKANGYISFDKRGTKGEWVTYLINKYLIEREGEE